MMARRPFVLSAVLAPLALLVSGCGSTEKFRYKMTVEVETPQGTKTGYAVREVTHSTPPSIPMLGESRPTWSVVGEAVAVDLPDGQTLFALLTNGVGGVSHAGTDMWFLFRELNKGSVQLWPNPPRTKRPEIENPLPMLVTFGDVKDPKSVVVLKPDDFEKRFGAGVQLKQIMIKKTHDNVTEGIGERLGWLGVYPENRLKSPSAKTNLPYEELLVYGDFRQGVK